MSEEAEGRGGAREHYSQFYDESALAEHLYILFLHDPTQLLFSLTCRLKQMLSIWIVQHIVFDEV